MPFRYHPNPCGFRLQGLLTVAILSAAAFVLSPSQQSSFRQANTKVIEFPAVPLITATTDRLLSLGQFIDAGASDYLKTGNVWLPSPFMGPGTEARFLFKYPHDCKDPPKCGSFYLPKYRI